MSRYRIRVIARPRKRPDVAMLAQVVILLGRHLHAKRLREQQEGSKHNPQ